MTPASRGASPQWRRIERLRSPTNHTEGRNRGARAIPPQDWSWRSRLAPAPMAPWRAPRNGTHSKRARR
eukprot:3730540-Pyramimonas_sp.AAC.1